MTVRKPLPYVSDLAEREVHPMASGDRAGHAA